VIDLNALSLVGQTGMSCAQPKVLTYTNMAVIGQGKSTIKSMLTSREQAGTQDGNSYSAPSAFYNRGSAGDALLRRSEEQPHTRGCGRV
jgi:hypothetical protein